MSSRGRGFVFSVVGVACVGLLVAAPGGVAPAGASTGRAVSAGAVVSSAAVADGVEYTRVDLDSLGGLSSSPRDVNDQGQVVGSMQINPLESHAFLWDPVTGLRDLGTLGGASSGASAVNERGQVAGVSQVNRNSGHAFLWDPATGMRDLGTLGGRDSQAVDLNDRGQVVGWALTADWDRHAFLWDPETGMTDLDTFGSEWSEALAVNERGQVLGKRYDDGDGGDGGGFLWDPETGMTDLGWAAISAADLNERGQVVGGPPAFLWDPESGMTQLGGLPGHEESWAVDVNDDGLVAGWSGTWDDEVDRLMEQRAWLWDPATGMADLGTLGGDRSQAVALNERGQVTGKSETEPWGWGHVFLWDRESEMRDISGGFPGLGVVGLNERGQITGWISDESGNDRAVLWTPVALAPQVRVRVSRVGYGNQLRVNVNPNRIGDAWKFRVQKRVEGEWRTLPGVHWTRGVADIRTLTLGPGRFRVRVVNRYGYVGATSAAVRLTRPTVRVRVGTDEARGVLRVNVDPNRGSGYWTFQVQRKRADGTWRTLPKVYRTLGRAETREVDRRRGTYRVVVSPKYGFRGATSDPVRLVR